MIKIYNLLIASVFLVWIFVFSCVAAISYAFTLDLAFWVCTGLAVGMILGFITFLVAAWGNHED